MEGGAAQLTPGGVRAIAGGALPAEIQPVLQMLQVRQVSPPKSDGANPNPSERYRVVLSDGVDSHQAILSTTINPFVRDGALRVGTIVHLNEFVCNTIHDKRIIIVLELEILQTECAIIGSPRNYVVPNVDKVQDRQLLLKETVESIPLAQACWDLLLLQGQSRLLTIYRMVYPIMVLKALARQ
ncbi:unnamed protein product [Urochloa humidicola]